MLAQSLAVVLRALRKTRELTQERLPSSRSYAFALEAGTPKNISLGKLRELSRSLEITPLALMVLCESIESEQDTLDVIGKLKEELRHLSLLGLDEKIRKEQQSSSLVSKAKAREIAESKRLAVKRLKEEGKSRKEVAEALGLSKSSVQRFWV
ncbi:helix-turn-helix domain-containing protein [Pseudomonas sp. IPO3774]|uniref:helix-turn-helix domain-containing protein n=1 Tax=Pseudomonas sp. IPO3774 TaxID=2738826 RepID=UPI0015A165D9|nr:helix-turn-helix domain-containing protein [Pseudomonas sp. IPO3774]NWD65606.1 helix-turn-helix domain-containing protein [Pseudomonas sp. IPO3774]